MAVSFRTPSGDFEPPIVWREHSFRCTAAVNFTFQPVIQVPVVNKQGSRKTARRSGFKNVLASPVARAKLARKGEINAVQPVH